MHKDIYDNHMLHYKDSLSAAKPKYYTHLISSDKGNARALFSTMNTISRPPNNLPPHLYSISQCDNFMSFFKNQNGQYPSTATHLT